MTTTKVIINFLFFFSLVSMIVSEENKFTDCKYQLTKDDQEGQKTNCTYPLREDGENDTSYSQKCFSLSETPVMKGERCCYDPTMQRCGKYGTVSDSSLCPVETVEGLHNNCGMAGVYQPASPNICKEISLVQGYCCYVSAKDENGSNVSACVRSKKLEKDKKKPSKQIKEYVGKNITIDYVDCHGSFLKNLKLVVFIIASFILF